MREFTTTTQLAIWHGMTRAGVLKALREEGVKRRGIGDRGVGVWDRTEAMSALSRRKARRVGVANHSDVVYAESA